MNVCIIGSRNIIDVDFDALLSNHIDITDCKKIISGGASGIDTMAANYALENGIPLEEIRPDYSKGRAATFIRNRQMVDMSNIVIAFWNGKSGGTKYTIEYARKRCKPVIVIEV